MLRLGQTQVLLGFVVLLLRPDTLLTELVRAIHHALREIQAGLGLNDGSLNLQGPGVQIEFAERQFRFEGLHLGAIGTQLDRLGQRHRRLDHGQDLAGLNGVTDARKFSTGRREQPAGDRAEPRWPMHLVVP